MTRIGKLLLVGVLSGTLGLVGCSDDSGGGAGSGGDGGSGGSGGVPGTGGTGGTVEACGAGQTIDESYTTDTGLASCDGLGVIDVPIEVVLAAKSDTPDGETDVDVRVSLNLSEETVGNLGGLVQEALIGEASADVTDVPESGSVNVPATVPCTVDFTAGTAVEVVTPAVINAWTAVDGSIVLEVADITFAIDQPVPLTLSTAGSDPACVWDTVPTVTLPPAP